MSQEERVGGLDEVGLGALAGPIISAVAVFYHSDLKKVPKGVRDSKKMSESARGKAYLPICAAAQDIGVGHAWPWEIDRMGVEAALQLSYNRALEDLNQPPDRLIIDGLNPVHEWKGDYIARPKADNLFLEVSCASVIAKVFRDEIMKCYDRQYPQYGWSHNKGYGTEDHIKAIEDHGLLIGGRLKNSTKYLHRKLYCKKFKEKPEFLPRPDEISLILPKPSFGRIDCLPPHRF